MKSLLILLELVCFPIASIIVIPMIVIFALLDLFLAVLSAIARGIATVLVTVEINASKCIRYDVENLIKRKEVAK